MKLGILGIAIGGILILLMLFTFMMNFFVFGSFDAIVGGMIIYLVPGLIFLFLGILRLVLVKRKTG